MLLTEFPNRSIWVSGRGVGGHRSTCQVAIYLGRYLILIDSLGESARKDSKDRRSRPAYRLGKHTNAGASGAQANATPWRTSQILQVYAQSAIPGLCHPSLSHSLLGQRNRRNKTEGPHARRLSPGACFCSASAFWRLAHLHAAISDSESSLGAKIRNTSCRICTRKSSSWPNSSCSLFVNFSGSVVRTHMSWTTGLDAPVCGVAFGILWNPLLEKNAARLASFPII